MAISPHKLIILLYKCFCRYQQTADVVLKKPIIIASPMRDCKRKSFNIEDRSRIDRSLEVTGRLKFPHNYSLADKKKNYVMGLRSNYWGSFVGYQSVSNLFFSYLILVIFLIEYP